MVSRSGSELQAVLSGSSPGKEKTGAAGQGNVGGGEGSQEGEGQKMLLLLLLLLLQEVAAVDAAGTWMCACVRAGGRADLRWDADEMRCRRCLAWSQVACCLGCLPACCLLAACQVLWGSPGQSGLNWREGCVLGVPGGFFCGAGAAGAGSWQAAAADFPSRGRLLSP